MQRPLTEIEFRDPARSLDSLNRLTEDVEPVLISQLRSLIGASADPDEAVHFLERLHQDRQDAFQRITASFAGLQLLVAVFSHSRFLSEAVLAHPEWAEELLSTGDIGRARSEEEFEQRLAAFAGAAGVPSPVSLALFRRKELLRIVVRDVMGMCTMSETAGELSSLADAILDLSYRRIREELAARYGAPLAPGPDGPEESGFAIISLGKLGGRELNYSSDIDLMFVYGANGETAGPQVISNKEFFKKVANQLTALLSQYAAGGVTYRVDLRLRPEGRLGEVAISLEGAQAYYKSRARDWELQMLLKARVSAGDKAVGRELLEFVGPLIYSTTLDFSVVESASATRERIHEKAAARRGASGFNVKLAPGGIRDIEFLVQCLQRLHGGRDPWVRHVGTALALSRLRDKDFLSDVEYSRLVNAYRFLRNLEHRLQFYEDRQTHSLPEDEVSLATLARKMPETQIGGPRTAATLIAELKQSLEGVQEIYERVIHAQQPIYYAPSPVVTPAREAVETSAPDAPEGPVASNLVRYLDQKAPRLAAVLGRTTLRRGRVHFEHFLERVLSNPEWLDWLDADATLAGDVLDLFESSPYFSEQLIRTPELLIELRRLREGAGGDVPYQDLASAFDDPAELRRFFRREMFRIQSDSICLQRPIFTTLEQTSDLADGTIAAAYGMAVREVAASRPPVSARYEPKDRMMAITLGRLGMREFDLASDADLIFVLPDEDSSETVFWTRVAERMIAIISAYTGDGTMFAVDTRLRPNGRAGPLVQTESAYKSYFASQAEAWEGITYMKSRSVAGNLERGTAFLNDLQRVDWRRYGQSGRSRRQLAQMRARLEKEQGTANLLKSGFGGYYDIDFALMYLRLRGAGIFYRVLNTPARIDVVEQMGHLERSDADFLRDAATFFRAVDHGLRVASGHTEGQLPTAGAQLEALTALVRRWTPAHLHDQDLNVELAQIQARTRELFRRMFAE